MKGVSRWDCGFIQSFRFCYLVHPTCVEMPPRMVKRANEYAWQCRDCKLCMKCRRKDNDDKMLYCDQCDRGYHIYCIGLRKVPNGEYHLGVAATHRNSPHFVYNLISRPMALRCLYGLHHVRSPTTRRSQQSESDATTKDETASRCQMDA